MRAKSDGFSVGQAEEGENSEASDGGHDERTDLMNEC